MTRTTAEANAAIRRIDHLPYGVARSTAAAAELARVVAEGPDEARAYALFVTLKGYVWGGEVDKAFLPFTQLLRWWDTHPEHFDEYDQHSLFWSFKWMVSDLMDYPSITATQIEATITDMERRYVLASNGLNAVAKAKLNWATMRGGQDADRLFVEWTQTPRDEFSQCEACDPGDRAAHLYAAGRYDECIRLVEGTLPEQPSCATEPGDMLSFLQLAYLRIGDAPSAARVHRAAVQHLPSGIPAEGIRGRHVEFLARSANPDRALAMLTTDQGLLTKADTPYSRWIYLRAASTVTGLLRGTHGEAPLALREVPATTVAQLDDWARAEALRLAAAFDARNGSTSITDRTRASWDDTTVLPVDLSVFATASGTSPSVVDTPTDGERGVEAPSSSGPADLTTEAERWARRDPARAARAHAAAADLWRAEGRLERAGFAHAEAAMAASLAGDDPGARTQFEAGVALLRATGTDARFLGPVVRAWARREEGSRLDSFLPLLEELTSTLRDSQPADGVAEDLAARDRAERDLEARRLDDTRARIAATLTDAAAPRLAREAAQAFAHAGDHWDAGYGFWFLGTLLADGTAAVQAFESAMESFALAREAAARRGVGDELVGLLQRLDRPEEAEALATALSETATRR